ncbi:MAG: efflux RND transporter permease subunit [Paludibaculum sp.]
MDWTLRYRAIVLLGIVLTVVFGVYSLQRLPIDAVPDITPNQVLVLTRAPSLSPIEVEQFLTFPIESAMTGLPGVERIQSVSKNGLSYVAVYFREDVDTYFARRLVMERLPQARENIPSGMGSPEMGPIATGLGEVYQFKVSGSGRSLMELRSILDWDIAPKLRSVQGIVEVNTHGGELKSYEIQIDSEKLVAYHVSLEKLISSLEKSNANAGGAYLERMEQQSLVRGEALITSLADIEKIVVGVSPTGTPILVSNLERSGMRRLSGKGLQRRTERAKSWWGSR